MELHQTRQKFSHFSHERIGEDGGNLFFAAAARIPHQLAHVHIESQGQALQRTKRRNRLAVLDFGDVGARHLHAPCQLTLAQVAQTPDFAHLSGHLQSGFG